MTCLNYPVAFVLELMTTFALGLQFTVVAALREQLDHTVAERDYNRVRKLLTEFSELLQVQLYHFVTVFV